MLTERQVVGKIEVLEDGQIQLREDTVIERDGVEIHRNYHRRVLGPTLTPLSNVEDTRLRAIAPVVWTTDVVAEYERKKAKRAFSVNRG